MRLGRPTLTTTVALAVILSMVIAGVGIVAADNHKDGNKGNGEELKSGENDEQPVTAVNYTIRIDNHQPGNQNGAMEHYAEGATENITIHFVKVSSPHFDYSDCSSDNTRAFGIDRGNDDPGTQTDEPLLNSYESSSYKEDSITLKFYKEQQLAGEPRNVSIYDQIVARGEGCYDNPEDPGWYRTNGYINGSSTGDTKTDYNVTDFTDWVYICDCQNRQEATQKLGQPPGEKQVAYSDNELNSGNGNNQTPTQTPTPGGNENNETQTQTTTPGGNGNNQTQTQTATPYKTETNTTSTTTDGTDTTATSVNGGGGGGEETATPTSESQPGLGVAVTLLSILGTALVAVRRTL